MFDDQNRCTIRGNGPLQLVDETLRDGPQSLWGLGSGGYHGIEPVIGEIAEAGYYSINIPVTAATPLIMTRFAKQDPLELFRMFREKLKKLQVQHCHNPDGHGDRPRPLG